MAVAFCEGSDDGEVVGVTVAGAWPSCGVLGGVLGRLGEPGGEAAIPGLRDSALVFAPESELLDLAADVDARVGGPLVMFGSWFP